MGGSDGAYPRYGDLIFDQAGNIYGTAAGGWPDYDGSVYQLTPTNGGWEQNVLYQLDDLAYAGVIFDRGGSLYGTTYFGGSGDGSVFQLTPSGSGWVQKTIYTFTGQSDGRNPVGGLIFDESGNLYGTTISGGPRDGGTVFMLTPQLNGTWTFTLLYAFRCLTNCSEAGPWSSLVMDSAGGLYGTTYSDGLGYGGIYGYGSVFKLTPSNGGWTETDLYDFTGGSDGCGPLGNVIFDAKGNLYGTTYACGANSCNGDGCGVVFEITP